MNASAHIWVLADPRPGTANQALGIGENLGQNIQIKTLNYNILSVFPNSFVDWMASGFGSFPSLQKLHDLQPPWPDIVISSGRRAYAIANRIKRQLQPRCKIVQIMNPHWRKSDCDILAIPYHDGDIADAPNIIRTIGNPHRLTDARLQSGRQKFAPLWAHLPDRKIGLLLGGKWSNGKGLNDDLCRDAIRRANMVAQNAGAGLLISTSRRTPAPSIDAIPHLITEPYYLYDWRAGGENPYDGILASVDAVIVSGDSTSMMTESCFIQKPVYIYAPPPIAIGKFGRLADNLTTHGFAHIFNDTIDFHANSRRLNPNAAIIEKIMPWLNNS